MKRFLISVFLINILFCNINISIAQENPDDAQLQPGFGLKKQGIIFYNDGKFLEALNCFERLDKSIQNDEILLLIANCYDSLNNSKKASEYLIKAIEYNPGNANPYYNLGVLLYKNKDINGAIEDFKKAIKFNPAFTAAYYNLGICYYQIKDFKKAKDSFISAIKLEPENPNVCYSLVVTYNALEDKKMAEKYLDIYSKISKKNAKNDLKSESEIPATDVEKPALDNK